MWCYLYHRNSWPRRTLSAWITKKESRLKNLVDNHRAPSEDTSLQHYTYWMVVLLHHGSAFAFSLAGYVSSSTALVRFGLSFEIGEDLLHYCELAYSTLHPPGTELMAQLYPTTLLHVMIAFHHILGLACGSYGFLNASHWPDVQLLIVILLGSTLPGMFAIPLLPLADLNRPSAVGKVALVLGVLGTIASIYGRFVLFIPLVQRLLARCYDEFGSPCSVAVAPPLFLFFVFSTCSLLSGLAALPAAIRHQQTQHVGHPQRLALLRAASSSFDVLGPKAHGASKEEKAE